MADADVKLSLPPSWFFKFPPDPQPESLTPPPADGDFHPRSPITIPRDVFNEALNPTLPIVFAICYIVVVALMNRHNRRRDYKPYAISQTRIFQWLVILHNVGLAIYSGVTCAAMLRAVHASFPGFSGPHGLAGAADALCKIHGPRGYGDAVTFDSTSLEWIAHNRLIHLSPDGLLPDATDVGRIWNEGLAFWGWLFYLSKFYEVIDTAIILAKGKRSSTLQTYHHAGAMLCMWSGIRYMSPPIWMFVLVNAGIHTMMYTYYSISALKFRVPSYIKSTITTLQIAQFLVGASYASLHLFVSYKMPITIHQTLGSILSSVPPAASEAAASFAALADELYTSASVGSAAAEATAHPSSWLMKLLYRAGGAEGLAETVHNQAGEIFGPEYGMSPNLPKVSPLEELQYRSELQDVQCLDTSGEAFAIWLNVLYLTPLTALFVRFFIRTYIMRKPNTSTGERKLVRSASGAANETQSAAEVLGKAVEEKLGEAVENTKQAMKTTGTEGYRELVDSGSMSDEATQDAADEDTTANGHVDDKEGEESHPPYEEATEVSAKTIRIPSRTEDTGGASPTEDASKSENNELVNVGNGTLEYRSQPQTSLEESGELVDLTASELGPDVRDRGSRPQSGSFKSNSSGAAGKTSYDKFLFAAADKNSNGNGVFGKLSDKSRPKTRAFGLDKNWFSSGRAKTKQTPAAEKSPSAQQAEVSAEDSLTPSFHQGTAKYNGPPSLGVSSEQSENGSDDVAEESTPDDIGLRGRIELTSLQSEQATEDAKTEGRYDVEDEAVAEVNNSHDRAATMQPSRAEQREDEDGVSDEKADSRNGITSTVEAEDARDESDGVSESSDLPRATASEPNDKDTAVMGSEAKHDEEAHQMDLMPESPLTQLSYDEGYLPSEDSTSTGERLAMQSEDGMSEHGGNAEEASLAGEDDVDPEKSIKEGTSMSDEGTNSEEPETNGTIPQTPPPRLRPSLPALSKSSPTKSLLPRYKPQAPSDNSAAKREQAIAAKGGGEA